MSATWGLTQFLRLARSQCGWQRQQWHSSGSLVRESQQRFVQCEHEHQQPARLSPLGLMAILGRPDHSVKNTQRARA